MTDDTTTPIPGAESHADGPTPPSEGGGAGSIPDEPQKGNREARYRVERNEARGERDALSQRVELLQTRELERIAGEHLSNPADLLALSGKTLADFLGEDGELDAELVAEAASEVVGSRPGLRPNAPAFDPSQGLGGHEAVKAQPTFAALLKA